MEEKELKTSTGQRIAIALIAIIMVGTIVASYAAIVINGNKSNSDGLVGDISDAKIAEYEDAYDAALADFNEVSAKDFEEFSKYLPEVKAYNEDAANSNGVVKRDLSSGSGDVLEAGDTNYLAYYIGWCADETVFDSSFDDAASPKELTGALDPSQGLIEGWNEGVVGMKRGGVREITIPGALAYGDSMEICGGYNKPLKFIVMAVDNKDPLKATAEALDLAQLKLQYAYYGIDYDAQMAPSDTSAQDQ